MKNLTQTILLGQILILVIVMIVLIIDPMDLEVAHKKAILLALAVAVVGALLIILIMGILMEKDTQQDRCDEIHQKIKAGLDPDEEE